MSALGSLVVNLGLNFAQYTGGLDKSEQATLAAAKRIQDTWDNTKSRIAQTAGAIAGGLAAGFTINAFKGLIAGAIETGAALDDLAMQTGATVEALSGLVQVGKYNNMGPEAIGGAMNKLAANLAGATEESKGTGKALEALGINFDSFKRLRPEEQMQTVAKAMAGYKDSADKGAVAMALFGKQGAQMLPFLKDLAEVEELATKTTTEQAAAAANLDDNLDRITKSGEAWKKELAQGMIPALDLGAQAFLDVMNGTGGLREEVRKLVADGSVAQWTKGAVTGLTYVADAGQYLWRVLKTLGQGLAAYVASTGTLFSGVAEGIKKAIMGDYSGAFDTIKSGILGAKNIVMEFGSSAVETFSEDTFGAKIRARMVDIEGMGAKAEETKPKLDFTNVLAKNEKATKEAKNPLDALLETIDKRIAVGQEELAMGEKLTDGEKLAAEINLKVKNSKDAQIIAGKALIATKLKEMLATEESVAAHRLELQTLQDIRQERVKQVQAMEQSVAQMLESNQSLRDEIELIGLTEGQQLRILQRRNEITIATKKATLAELERRSAVTGTQTREEIALQQEIELLEERNGLMGEKYDRTESAEAGRKFADQMARDNEELRRGLGDAIETAIFQGGKAGGQKLRDVLQEALLRKPLRMMIDGFLNQLTGGVLNMLLGGGGALGGAAGGGNPLGGLLSLGSSAYNAYSGLTSGTGVLGSIGSYFGLGSKTVAAGANMNLLASGIPGAQAIGSGSLAAGGGLTTVGAGSWTAGGIAGLIAAVVINAFGGMRSESMIGSGLRGTLDGKRNLEPWEEWREGGGLLFGPEFTNHNPLATLEEYRKKIEEYYARPTELQNSPQSVDAWERMVREMEKNTSGLQEQVTRHSKAINDGYNALRTNIVGMANSLGLAGSKVEDFALTLDMQDLNFQGLKPEEIQEKIAKVMEKAGNSMAKELLGYFEPVTETITRQVRENVGSSEGQDSMYVYRTETETSEKMVYRASQYAKAGETALETLTRLSSAMTTFNNVSDALGFGMQEVGLAAASAADKFLEAAGGLERVARTSSSFIDAYYSDEEKRQALARRGASEARRLGYKDATPEMLLKLTPDDIKNVVNSLADNPALYFDAQDWAVSIRGLYDVSAAVDQAVEPAQALSSAVDLLTQSYDNAIKSLTSDRDRLAVERLRAEGDEAGAKALEKSQYMAQFQALDEVRRREIETLYDANVATRAYIDGLKAAATAQRDRLAALRDATDSELRNASANLDRAMANYERLAAEEKAKLNETITAVRSVFDAASSGAKALFGEVDAVVKFQGRQGQDFISAALAKAKATGQLPDGKELAEAISGANAGLGKEVFASQAEADYARLVMANELKGLADISGEQLTEAEAQLKRLDENIKIGREQIEKLRGIEGGVKTMAEALDKVLEAWAQEVTTRERINGQVIRGSGQAIFDRQSGTGLTESGTVFDAAVLAAEAAKAIAAAPGAATANKLYDMLDAGGYTLAQYNQMFGMPAGTLEAEAKAMGRPIFHKGTNYVPNTGFALLERGEAVIPAAANPFAPGRGGLGGDTAVLEALLWRLTGQMDVLQGSVAVGSAAARATADLLASVKNGSALNTAAVPTF
ncbi:MAG: hypothetical protein ACO1PM_08080 [Acidovorax sp.]